MRLISPMGLETGSYISDLVASNPLASDGISQGDDHLRLIKSVLQGTFPNITGAVTPTQDVLNGLDGRVDALETAEGASTGFIRGMVPSNNATDAFNDLDFSAGICAADDNASILTFATSLTGQLDVNFGTGNGMKDSTISLGNQTWHIFAIGGDGQTTRPFASTSLSPTLPSGYTLKRRIHSIRRDAQQGIYPFQAYAQAGGGLIVYWDNPIMDYNSASVGTSLTNTTLTIPLDVRFRAFVNVTVQDTAAGSNHYTYVTFPGVPDPTLNAGLAHVWTDPSTATIGTNFLIVLTNTSAQIARKSSVNSASYTVRIATYGWIDGRQG